jgi:uncharacterized integral membrane protein
MSKFKAFWLLIFGAVLAIFIVQNWYYLNPPIHFLGFQFLPFPLPVIILGFFLLGFISGWLINAFGAKVHKQEASPESAPES